MTPDERALLGETMAWCSRRDRSRQAMVRRVLRLLELPELPRAWPTLIKVAGTNGKGSVVAMLEAALLADGRRVGSFCSPHLVSVTERVRINGRPISLGSLHAAAERALPAIRRAAAAQPEPELIPSFFEALLLMALDILDAERVDVAIIEAGVGGANDATSLLPGDLAVITTVGLDHCDRLGQTVEEIAADKAGIAVDGQPLVLGPGVGPEAEASIRSALVALGRDAEIIRAGPGSVTVHRSGLEGSQATIDLGPAGSVELRLPLAGRFQIENLATVTAVVKALAEKGRVTDPSCLGGICSASWPGRLERLAGSPTWLLDVAHNPDGIEALATSLDELATRMPRLIVLGSSKDEAFPADALPIERLGEEIWVVDGFYGAIDNDTLAGRLTRNGAGSARWSGRQVAVRAKGHYATVVEELSASPAYRQRQIVVTGSVFLVGAVRHLLEPGPASPDPVGVRDQSETGGMRHQ